MANEKCPKCGNMTLHENVSAKGLGKMVGKAFLDAFKRSTQQGFATSYVKLEVEYICDSCGYKVTRRK